MAVDVVTYPVFTRWQVCCSKCGTIFYIDAEPGTTKERIISLEDLDCELHPMEDHVLDLI